MKETTKKMKNDTISSKKTTKTRKVSTKSSILENKKKTPKQIIEEKYGVCIDDILSVLDVMKGDIKEQSIHVNNFGQTIGTPSEVEEYRRAILRFGTLNSIAVEYGKMLYDCIVENKSINTK